jgi:hypothetical protein
MELSVLIDHIALAEAAHACHVAIESDQRVLVPQGHEELLLERTAIEHSVCN